MTAGWLERRSNFHAKAIAAAADEAFKAGNVAKATALYRSILKHHRRSPQANLAMNFLLSRRASEREPYSAAEVGCDGERRSKIWPVVLEAEPAPEPARSPARKDRRSRSVPLPTLLAIATLEAASGAATAMPLSRTSADEQPVYEERASAQSRGARNQPWKDRFVADGDRSLELARRLGIVCR
jgi:hypothetical protein